MSEFLEKIREDSMEDSRIQDSLNQKKLRPGMLIEFKLTHGDPKFKIMAILVSENYVEDEGRFWKFANLNHGSRERIIEGREPYVQTLHESEFQDLVIHALPDPATCEYTNTLMGVGKSGGKHRTCIICGNKFVDVKSENRSDLPEEIKLEYPIVFIHP